MHRLVLRPILALLGLYHLLLGVAMVAAPRTFFDDVATYGAFNDHYIRDVATLLPRARRRCCSWRSRRRPGRRRCWRSRHSSTRLHVLNHLWDISDTDPGWLGPANAAALALIGAVLLWLLRGGGEGRGGRGDREAVTPPR